MSNKPSPAASLMPAGLAAARIRALVEALEEAYPGRAISQHDAGIIVTALDRAGWSFMPHSVAAAYAAKLGIVEAKTVTCGMCGHIAIHDENGCRYIASAEDVEHYGKRPFVPHAGDRCGCEGKIDL